MVAIAKYLKVYIYGKGDGFCLFCGIPYDKLEAKDRRWILVQYQEEFLNE